MLCACQQQRRLGLNKQSAMSTVAYYLLKLDTQFRLFLSSRVF